MTKPIIPVNGSRKPQGAELLKRSAAGVPQQAQRGGGSTPGWKQGAKIALKRFCFVALPVIVWTAVAYFDLLASPITHNISMLVVLVIFVLSMPLSVLLRLDTMLDSASVYFNEPELMLVLIGLPCMLANFLLIGAARGALKGRSRGRQ